MKIVVWSLSVQGIKVLFSFVSIVLLSRLISPDEYGRFIVLSAVLVLLMPFIDFALTPIYVRRKEVNKYLGDAFYTANIYVSFLAFLFLFLYLLIYYESDLEYSWVFLLGVGVVFCGGCQQKIARLMRDDNYRSLFFIVSCSQIVSLSAACFFALLKMPIIALCMKFFLEHFVFWCVSVFVFGIKNRMVSFGFLKEYKSDFLNAFHVLVGRFAESFGLFSERILLSTSYDTGSLGSYYRAVDFGRIADFVVRGGLTGIVINRYRKSDESGFNKSIYVFSFFVVVALGISIILYVFGESLIFFLLGSEWGLVSSMVMAISLYSFYKIVQNSCYIICVCNEYYRLWSFLIGLFYVFYIALLGILIMAFDLDIVSLFNILTIGACVYWFFIVFLISIKVWNFEKS